MKKSWLSRLLFLMLIGAFIVGINGCMVSKNAARTSYVVDYKTAAEKRLADAVVLKKSGFDKNWVKTKIDLALGNMKAEGLAQRITEVYSDNLYFNDTIHTHTNAADLAQYMEAMAKRVHAIDIHFDDVIVNEKDAYIRWSMSFKSKANSAPVNSVGMTHLRFNSQGKIILHQDYWDGVEGFYRTVPVLGFMLERIRKAL